jgi:hypothetical protein
MRNPAGINAPHPSESGARPSPTRRAFGRFIGHSRNTGRRRPQSIEIDARLQATHVRPGAFRSELS